MLRIVKRQSEAKGWSPKGMSPLFGDLLTSRGVDSDEAAERFLNPCREHLRDPMLLNCMPEAVEIIRKHVGLGNTICVWGDYDVDGVTSCAILVTALRRLGAKVTHHLPLRETEGYGLNVPGVMKVSETARLLITVDCGVNAFEAIGAAQNAGLEVVVTDHHRPDDVLPDCPVVNPLLGGYPFGYLCGAGVAFKLATALLGERAWDLIDLAALGTVADLVPLQDENRVLVFEGLQAINAGKRPGIQALCGCAGLRDRRITSENIAYQIAPRLNASGRLDDADRAYRLLMSESAEEAMPLAEELETLNGRRQQQEREIVDDAYRQLADFDIAGRHSVVLAGETWGIGVIGLVASRVVERTGLPSVLLTRREGDYVGSCRSIPGVDMYAMLDSTRDLLTRFGGHAMAAGLTLPAENLPQFREAFEAAVRAGSTPEVFIPQEEYDVTANLSQIDEGLVRQLAKLEPTGTGNPAPVFLSDAEIVSTRAVGADQSHLQLSLAQDRRVCGGIWFRHGDLAGELAGAKRQVLYTPFINEYNGRTSMQLRVKEIGPCRALRTLPGQETALRRKFLTSLLYNTDILPSRAKRSDAMSALRQRFSESVRGTLGVFTTLQGIKYALAALEAENLSDRFDICEGFWPKDARAFNALCLLPAGERPRGYDAVICPDAPCELVDGDLTGAFPNDWLSRIADVDDMRGVYAFLRTGLKKAGGALREDELLEQLRLTAGIPDETSVTAIAVLLNMDLLSREAGRISLRPVQKKSPENDPLYQALMTYRQWGGAADE